MAHIYAAFPILTNFHYCFCNLIETQKINNKSVEQNLVERLLLPLTECTYFDAGGLVVVFPFSSDCMWFSRASKRLLGALKERKTKF